MKLKEIILICALALTVAPSVLHSQMLDPAIDRTDEPFCYFSKPTDVIGVMDGKQGTMVTPEGYLYTGWGEYVFMTGNPLLPINQRVKTLLSGYLPVVQYQWTEHGVLHQMTAFAATLDGKPESPLMNFVRVKMKNTSHEKRTAFFGLATRYQNDVSTDYGFGDNRFPRPVKAEYLGGNEQAGVAFSPDWEYGFKDDMMLRDGKVMYLFPTKPQMPQEFMTLKTGYNEVQEMGIYKLPILPTSPVGITKYSFSLNPGEEVSLDFKIPYEAIPAEQALVGQLRNASFDQYLKQSVAFWDTMIGRGIEITVPEEKVNNTFKANLIYDLIARSKHDSLYIQTVNDFQYHNFWLRDAAYIIRMYDVSGYHDIAGQCLEFFPRWQQPDGNFVSQGGQYDGWGQTLWAYGEHYRMTKDKTFAEKIYPSVVKAVAWLKNARKADRLHVMPVTTPGDNEQITGHVTGHNFAALGGLKNAVILAEALGKKEDADIFRREYENYLTMFLNALHAIAAKNNGAMPPGLDTLGGNDWGNMESVYPEIILDPSDPLVTATLNATQEKYQEGIMTYGDGRYLHHYLTISNTETEVVRGDQQQAVAELYSVLAHTSATHAGFEFAILPWATRDFGANLSPHGWFSAKFRTLLRNMMVREQGNDLHLLSVLSPEWIKDGSTISVKRAPTEFGTVGMSLVCGVSRASLALETDFREGPKQVILHLPWFMNVRSVTAGGKRISVTGSTVVLPAGSKKVDIAWSKKLNVPAMNYISTVNDYKKEYARRYKEFLKEGK